MKIIPPDSGTYALFLYLPNSKILNIGKLGRFRFPAGDYIYTGSAFGPGGLRSRLERHIRRDGRTHWHIDYFRASAKLRGICYLASEHSYECQWSQAIADLTLASFPAPGFGASDCRKCHTHLTAFTAPEVPVSFRQKGDEFLDLIIETLTKINQPRLENIECLKIQELSVSSEPQGYIQSQHTNHTKPYP